MLSTGAFNALLKTLEEPPEHVKFILATTEPQKLPATILSRCQRFDFKRISNEDIIKRLEIVCKESQIEITQGALNIIAVLSEGAMRDALSILERCTQDGENRIDEDKIKDLVGIPKLEYVHSIISAILEYNLEDAIKETENILNQGKDLDNFLWEMIKYVKDILIFKSCGMADLYTENEKNLIKDLSSKYSNQRLVKLVYDLSELQNNMKWSTQKNVLFEAGMIKFCYEEPLGQGNIEERLTKIENFLRNQSLNVNQNLASSGVYVNFNANQTSSNTIVNNMNKNTEKAGNINNVTNKIEKNTKLESNKSSYSGNIEEAWPKIVRDLKQSGKIVLYTNLMNTKAVEMNDLIVGIQFPKGITAFGKTVLEKQENIREISNLVSMACGKEMQIKYIDTSTKVNNNFSAEKKLQDFAKDTDIPLNIIE